MQTEKHSMKKDDPHHPALTPTLRWMSNMICLWGLCSSPACRRARACKRDPRECLARYAPLVPKDAREGVKAMMEGLRCGLSYDEVRDGATDEVAAVEDWIECVEDCARRASAAP